MRDRAAGGGLAVARPPRRLRPRARTASCTSSPRSTAPGPGGSTSVASSPPGRRRPRSPPARADVFVRTASGTIAQRYDAGAGWSGWLELGGRHVSGPTSPRATPNGSTCSPASARAPQSELLPPGRGGPDGSCDERRAARPAGPVRLGGSGRRCGRRRRSGRGRVARHERVRSRRRSRRRRGAGDRAAGRDHVDVGRRRRPRRSRCSRPTSAERHDSRGRRRRRRPVAARVVRSRPQTVRRVDFVSGTERGPEYSRDLAVGWYADEAAADGGVRRAAGRAQACAAVSRRDVADDGAVRARHRRHVLIVAGRPGGGRVGRGRDVRGHPGRRRRARSSSTTRRSTASVPAPAEATTTRRAGRAPASPSSAASEPARC